MTFGEKLKSSRQSKNLTQKQIASALDIDQTNISNWEHNKNLPSPPVLIKLANILEISLDYLLTEESESLYEPQRLRAEKPEIMELYEMMTPQQQNKLLNIARGIVVSNSDVNITIEKPINRF